MKFYFYMSLLCLNNPKDLDLCYKMDLEFWDWKGKNSTL